MQQRATGGIEPVSAGQGQSLCVWGACSIDIIIIIIIIIIIVFFLSWVPFSLSLSFLFVRYYVTYVVLLL